MYKVVIRSIILKLHSEKIIVLTLDKHFKDTNPTKTPNRIVWTQEFVTIRLAEDGR